MGKVLTVYIKVSGILFQQNFHLKNNYKLLKLSIDYKDDIVKNIYEYIFTLIRRPIFLLCELFKDEYELFVGVGVE